MSAIAIFSRGWKRVARFEFEGGDGRRLKWTPIWDQGLNWDKGCSVMVDGANDEEDETEG